MASTNLTYTGDTTVLKATAYVTEVTTTGTSRHVKLRLTIKATDYTGNRDGYYSVSCTESTTEEDSVTCIISGSELDIFNEEFSVALNSDNTTADIDFAFSATVKSPSSGNKTITGSITRLTLTEYIPEYTLTISSGAGSSIVVDRTSSNYGTTGSLSNGSTIYSGDELKISFSTSKGYSLVTHTVNGSSFISGNTFTVTGNVSVRTTTKMLGTVHIYDGAEYVKYLIYIYNGTAYAQYMPYIYDGAQWNEYS